MTNQSIGIVLGTRPEIIKMSPVIRILESRELDFTLIHTGQHYSERLDSIFFQRLGLADPDYNLDVGSKSHAEQTAEMMSGIEEIIQLENISTLLVQGDTNSVLAGGLVASKLDVDLGHIEAGLRSYDERMPEEINRKVVDHISQYLFVPTETSRSQLLNEGIPDERIFTTGNTVVDALFEHSELAASQSTVLNSLEIHDRDYILLTAHRAENVDNQEQFVQLLDGVNRFAQSVDVDVVYPIHPRAKQSLDQLDISKPSKITLIEPQDYLDFIKLQQNAEIVFTDSGGVQEECCILGVPCVTLRTNTERPETIDVGANRLSGTNPDTIVQKGQEMWDRNNKWDNPFGNGTTAEQIVDIIQTHNNSTGTSN